MSGQQCLSCETFAGLSTLATCHMNQYENNVAMESIIFQLNYARTSCYVLDSLFDNLTDKS